jgi:hypothetical protein
VGWIAAEDAFAVWAPDGGTWSAWAKPMAFVQASGTIATVPIEEMALRAIHVALEPHTTVIVDLTGSDAVYAGLSLASGGFRPVPLFNGTSGPSPVIDVAPITRALGSGVERLAAMTLSPEAPPAFLLDSRRDGVGAQVEPGSYDNRWVVLPQDFPSGAFLQSRGVTNATLMRRNGLSVPVDLAHVLRRWQDVGIRINVTDVTTGRTATDVTVPMPSRFKLAWYAAVALLGLHRSNVGGFGSVIPHETGRRGFYG